MPSPIPYFPATIEHGSITGARYARLSCLCSSQLSHGLGERAARQCHGGAISSRWSILTALVSIRSRAWSACVQRHQQHRSSTQQRRGEFSSARPTRRMRGGEARCTSALDPPRCRTSAHLKIVQPGPTWSCHCRASCQILLDGRAACCRPGFRTPAARPAVVCVSRW